ncbi:hypothetical protein J19TS2_40240 [Cohnella xylanilytica]|uniref:C39 family peptidase n=1 Tax=Cohnella xylanilytica TaxID=557555 RepID=A0A841U294_9BACL|nr:C39 family peptidase [Cohnella xylanilytica]MBB6693298.1 C39 family peptidase [Cohnella xylanilytica]GIO14469.1 hypothetical protein J19TS2_40240 [Cohnella xylanilytica]
MKKKWAITGPAIAFILLIGNSVSTAAAQDSGSTGALLNDPSLSVSKAKTLKTYSQQKDEWASKLYKNRLQNRLAASGARYTISVTGYQQEEYYYCGPASVRQTLSFHKSSSGSTTSLPSQATLAKKIGTTTQGSTTTGITDTINTYANTYGFVAYASSNLEDESDPEARFRERISADIVYENGAPIILLQTKFLPRYGGKSIRHYNTVSGYDDTSSSPSSYLMRLHDPNDDSDYYGTYWDPVGSKTANGVFKAVYEADKQGTNMAMSW